MALEMTAKHHIWLISAIGELLKDEIPSAVFADNMSAIDIAHNPKVNDRSKHIDIKYHFTRELIDEGKLVLLHVPSADNLADICTKGLPRPGHQHLCTYLSGTGTK
jgi:hypothetical protein